MEGFVKNSFFKFDLSSMFLQVKQIGKNLLSFKNSHLNNKISQLQEQFWTPIYSNMISKVTFISLCNLLFCIPPLLCVVILQQSLKFFRKHIFLFYYIFISHVLKKSATHKKMFWSFDIHHLLCHKYLIARIARSCCTNKR